MAFAPDLIRLQSEDRMRMTRLYEEVVTRLEEMAMITARALQLDARAVRMVKFVPLAEEEEHDFARITILSTPELNGGYDYREGACFETADSNS